MSSLQLAFLTKKLQQLPFSSGYYVAFSGGMDSTVLCHALAQLSLPVPLCAIYIDHGLQSESAAWEKHCRFFCQQNKITFQSIRLNLIKKKGESLEAVARTARYQALQQMIPKDGILLTAQHADDQVETVLLQLLRGSGTKGLSAMPFCKKWHQGWHARPLLECDQQSLHEYALKNQLKWIEDPSNQDTIFERNYLRLAVIPALKKHWSGLTKTIPRSALYCAESEQLNQTITTKIIQKITDNRRLNYQKLLTYDPILQKHVLRDWILKSGFLLPNSKRLAEIQRLINHSKYASGLVCWQDTECRLYQQHLYLMLPLKKMNLSESLNWQIQNKILQLPYELGCLEINDLITITSALLVCFKQNKHQKTGKKLKKIFQAAHIPPWQRKTIPLIYHNKELIQVGNIWSSQWLKANCIKIKWKNKV